MIALSLTIILTTFLFLVFKEFQKRNINTNQAITFNYLTAALIALFIGDVNYNIYNLINTDWFYSTIALGLFFIVMFNIMDEPLRLSLFTIGQLINLVKRNTELSETQAYAILEENPEKYIQMAVQDMEVLGTYGVENVKIPLNSKENAQKARLVLTSMVNNQHYLQKSKYFINGETIEKEQKVDTIPLIPQLKMMLEIVKRWDGFDSLKFKEEIESGKIKL